MKDLLNFFSFSADPFGDTPNTSFLYSGRTHREAFATLLWGINANRGFVCLTAKPGMGKTTLLFKLMSELNQEATTAFVFQTQADPDEMLRHLVTDLGLSPEGNLAQIHAELNRFLRHQARLGKRVLLIVDEAQNLQDSVLEMLRLVSDFETEQRKLVQFVLSGQSQLAERLADPSLEQLRQRIAAVARLEPFDENEVARYIRHRLTIARPAEPQLFSDDAVRLIALASQGIPREINSIAFSSLCIAYATRQRHIDVTVVQEAVNDRSLSPVSGETDEKPYSAAAAFVESDAMATPTKDRRTTGRRGADFQYVRSQSQQVGLIVNIGPGGAALWVSAPDEWGDSQIEFRLPGVAFPLMIHGTVVWRHESQRLIGMLFSDVPPKARAALDAWLASPQDTKANVELALSTAPGSTTGENYEEERVAIDFTRNDASGYLEMPAAEENGALSESSDQLRVGLSILRPPNPDQERVFQKLWTSLVGPTA